MSIKRKVVFIHFQPLEFYPPVMNMIDFLGKEKDIQLYVISNHKKKINSLSKYIAPSGVKIFKPAIQSGNVVIRYINYLRFYFSAFFLLLIFRPTFVLYFETLSSWPALFYKMLRGNNVKLMVHYHEYSEPQLYAQNMLLSKWMHRLEKKMYYRYSWISQTNPVRMELFKTDNKLNDMPESVFHVMPNYPSRKWLNQETIHSSNNELKKLVFVGSLGYKNMYLQEVINWLEKHQEKFSLDIYSYNIDENAKKVLEAYQGSNIRFLGGCDYFSLSAIFKNYDIGLDIYKPFALNHIHGVSNKVFEYLACGLDVWFSIDKPQTSAFIAQGHYPKVIPVNFNELNSFDYNNAISRQGLMYKSSEYFYENVYTELVKFMTASNG